MEIDNEVWIYMKLAKKYQWWLNGVQVSIPLTWFAITHALLTASASTSSGRDISWPSGPVTPAASNFFAFCNKFMAISKNLYTYIAFYINILLQTTRISSSSVTQRNFQVIHDFYSLNFLFTFFNDWMLI